MPNETKPNEATANKPKDVSNEMTKNNIVGGLKNTWWGIKKAATEVTMAVGQFVPSFIKHQYEGSALQKGVAAVKIGAATVAQGVSNAVGWVGGKIRDGVLRVFPPEGRFVGFFRAIGRGISTAVQKVGQGIVFAASKVAQAAVFVAGKVAAAAVNVAGRISKAYQGSGLQKAVQAVGKVLAPVGRGIKKVATGIATGIGIAAYGIGKALSAVGNVVNKGVDKLRDIFGGVSFETNDIKEEIFERNQQTIDKTYNERVEAFRTKQAVHDVNPNEIVGDKEKIINTIRHEQENSSVHYYDGDKEKSVDVFDNISYVADTNRLSEQLNNEKGFGEGSHEMRAMNAEGKDIDLDTKHEGFTQRIDETNSKDIINQKNEAEGKEAAAPVEIKPESNSHTVSELEVELYGNDDLIATAAYNIIQNKKAEKKLDNYAESTGKEIKNKAVDKHYGKLLFEAVTSRKQVISTEKMTNVNVLVIAALCKATQSMTGLDVDKIGKATAFLVNEVASHIKEMKNDKKLVIENIFGGELGFKKAQEKFNMNGEELLHEVVRSSKCAELKQVADRIRLEQTLQIASNFNKGYAHGSEKFVESAHLVDSKGCLDVEKTFKLLGGSLRIKDVLATRAASEQGRTKNSLEKELNKTTQIKNKAIDAIQKKVSNPGLGMSR